MRMSSVKRGETLPGPARGPFYSRYTEHKVAFCFQSADGGTTHATSPQFSYSVEQRGSPDKHSLSESPSHEFRPGSFETSPPPQFGDRCDSRTDRQSVSSEFGWKTHSPGVSRGNSSDSFQSSLRASPLEFRSVSPTVYENQISPVTRDLPETPASSSPTCVLGGTLIDRRNAYVDKNSLVNNNCLRGKFANLVSKHSVNILSAAAFKAAHSNSRQKKLTHSCPDLITSPSGEREKPAKENVKKKTVSISELESYSCKLQRPPHSNKNKLNVPDIFTTSFTHSTHKEVPASGAPRVNTYGLQDIPATAKRYSKDRLRRAISLTRTLPEHILGPNMYRDEQVSQITDYMFIGTIDSAFNERRLCRLDIESLVDISNVGEMQVPSHRKIQCPCLCQTEFKHFRSRLTIAIADEENENIDQYFEEVSRFIEGARRCSKKVLIYSFEGKSRAALFAIQYLMAYEGLLLRQAYNVVKKQRPQVSLNASFQRALEDLEKTLFPDEKHSVNICNEYLNVADPQAIKCAWIDC